MSEQFTERDCHILSIMLKGKGDWDYITTAGGFSNRKSAQKAARQVTAKLPLPPPTTGGLATQPQELPPPTTGGSFSQSRRELHTTGSKKGDPKSDASAGRVKTPKKGEGIAEDTGEGVGQGVGEGVGQGFPQSSDRFIVGRPYSENHDPDYRLSRRERLKGDESSSDDDDNDNDDDDEEMEEY
ncbi:hypothetical protein KC351_g3263 [Hortaea werneckii]|nr:hypothetical protein KC351_g3263 [Hortaea werneckii]